MQRREMLAGRGKYNNSPLPANFFVINTQQQPPPHPVFVPTFSASKAPTVTAPLPPPTTTKKKKSRRSPPPPSRLLESGDTESPPPIIEEQPWIVADGFNATDTACCGVFTKAGEAERQDFNVIFRQRLARLNISWLGGIAHIWELVVLVAGMMSLTDLAIPSSPGIWWPIVVICMAAIFFIFFCVARFTAAEPTSILLPTGGWLRNDRYQANDEWHFWIAFFSHALLGIFELTWAMIKVDNIFPIDPITDTGSYVQQQILHVLLVAICLVMFTYFTFANSTGSRRLALAYQVV